MNTTKSCLRRCFSSFFSFFRRDDRDEEDVDNDEFGVVDEEYWVLYLLRCRLICLWRDNCRRNKRRLENINYH